VRSERVIARDSCIKGLTRLLGEHGFQGPTRLTDGATLLWTRWAGLGMEGVYGRFTELAGVSYQVDTGVFLRVDAVEELIGEFLPHLSGAFWTVLVRDALVAAWERRRYEFPSLIDMEDGIRLAESIVKTVVTPGTVLWETWRDLGAVRELLFDPVKGGQVAGIGTPGLSRWSRLIAIDYVASDRRIDMGRVAEVVMEMRSEFDRTEEDSEWAESWESELIHFVGELAAVGGVLESED